MITREGKEMLRHNFLLAQDLINGVPYGFSKVQFGSGNDANSMSMTSLTSAIEEKEYSIDITSASQTARISIEDPEFIEISINEFKPETKSAIISELGVFCKKKNTDEEKLFARFVFDPIPVSQTSGVSMKYRIYL